MSDTSAAQAEEIKRTMASAIAHHNAGRLGQADALYADVLKRDAHHADALHLSGLVAHQSGNTELGLARIRQAIDIKPGAAMLHNNLGNILSEIGQDQAAQAAFQRVLELDLHFPPAHYNLGNLRHRAGDLAQAQQSYQRALDSDPDFAPAMVGLGNVLLEAGNPAEAEQQFKLALEIDDMLADAHAGLGTACKDQQRFQQALQSYRTALQLRADDAATLLNLAEVERETGDIDAAIASTEEAIKIDPKLPEAQYALATIRLHQGRLADAVAGLRQALTLRPEFAEAHYNLGHALRLQGQLDDCLASFARAIVLKPDFAAARWAGCIARIPIIHATADQVAVRRADYQAALDQLRAELRLQSQQEIAAAAAAIGTVQPFYLAYQGMNDRALQSAYGELVCRIQAARYPAAGAAVAAIAERGRVAKLPLRVGFVSGFFYHHSNWKMPIKGWIDHLDPTRFALFGYYTGQPARMDDATDHAKRACKKFYASTQFEHMLQAIRADELDVLIYPEIGMDPMTVRLAALRLAPVQCASWGHPDTSGMPSIDYYLSSELMEPPGADAHYSEKLVRLPNLSIHVAPAQPVADDYARDYFGLDAAKTVYFCAQSLFKYLPQFDTVFARIASQVHGSQFVFLDYPDSPWLTEQFRQRLVRAFDDYGLRCDDYVVISRHLNQQQYHGLTRVADIFLDSIGWSGCNSTMEAIQCNLPVVSMAGELMRGRHTLAMLTMMEMADVVAADPDQYVEMAVRLGNDGALRREQALRIAAGKHKLTADMACIRGLEKFLLEAAGVPDAAPGGKTGLLRRLFGK